MNYEEIRKLSEWLDKSSFTSYSLSIDGVSLSISKQQPQESPLQQLPHALTTIAAPTTDIENDKTALTPAPEQRHMIHSPIVGIYYESASPGGTPFVKVGQKVSKGDVLCLLEAMKLMNEVTTDVDGIIEEIFIKNGSMVEACMPLFEIKTKEG